MKKTFRTTALVSVAIATILDVPLVNAQVQLEEVIVTAQRRAESIQDVPIAITSVSGDQLEDARVNNIQNITALTPSISFNTTNAPAASSNIQIRGIGTNGQSRTFEGAVGIFIDGVYRSRSGAALSQFLDIEQLQILRGPQGTLFGKNTPAGAILLDSTAPDTKEFSGNITAEVGDFDSRRLKASVNIPLSDTAALRIAGVTNERDGYFDDTRGNSLDNQDDTGFKAQLSFQPTDSVEVKVIVDSSQSDGEGPVASFDAFRGPLAGVVDGLAQANGFGVPSTDINDREQTIDIPGDNDISDEGVAVHVNWETGAGDLSYVFGDRSYETSQEIDADFSGASILQVDERFASDFTSHELTFSGKVGNADYLVGAYFSEEEIVAGRDLIHNAQAQTYWDILFTGAFPAGFSNAAEGLFQTEVLLGTADSVAVFTHWDIELSEKFNLILGARYTEDEKTGELIVPFARDPLLDPLALSGTQPSIPYQDSFEDESVTGTVTLQYSPSDNTQWYLSYNRGYKSGGVNIDASGAGVPGSSFLRSIGVMSPPIPADPVFQSETVDAFELGLKTDWLDGRARTNFSVFYNDISNLQIAQFLGLVFTVLNAEEAESIGAEFEGLFQINDVWQLSGGVTYLETAAYGNDPSFTLPVPGQPELLGLSGRDFPNSPEFAANLGLSFNSSITNNLSLFGKVDVLYRGEHFTNTANNLTEDAYTLVNANIGLASTESGWTITAFVQNLTDEAFITQHYNTPLQGTDRNGFVNPPRTVGVSLSYDF